jgi:hypothetical protein
MTRSIVFRRIVGLVAVALALGAIAGPASAGITDHIPNQILDQRSFVQPPAPSTPAAADPASGGSSIDWDYIAIGASAAALALIAVGAGFAISQRRGRRTRRGTA